MSKIAIVGAGQSGLQLALGLLQQQHDVTLVTNRSAEAVGTGRVTSSQCMFDSSLQTERDLGIDFWAQSCPEVESIALAVVGPDGSRVIDWKAPLAAPAQSVDQRVKVPAWMGEFERRGGTLLVADVGIEELELLSADHELVVVASGKGEISSLFARDERRSAFAQPQRALALTYVTGMRERDDGTAVTFNLIPTVGEYFWFPALTTSGPCHIMVFEGVPGGPMDCWADVGSPEEHLAKSRWVLETFMPWEAERAATIALTDDHGRLAGRFTPTVREPVATLPSGAVIWGMADVVVLNDPITGQGSNNAAKCADAYLAAIAAHGDGPFESDWMRATFESYWEYAGLVTQWTNSLLGPPPEHIVNLLGAAGQLPSLASRIVNGFDNPPDYFPWWVEPAAADELVAHEAAAAAI